MTGISILGPGQYDKTEIIGSGGMKKRPATGSKGYTFSQQPREANSMLPIKRGGGRIGAARGDWKTDLAKTGAPIHAQITEK